MIDFIAVVQTMLDIYHSVKSPSAELLAPFKRIGKTDYAERFRIFTHQKKKNNQKKVYGYLKNTANNWLIVVKRVPIFLDRRPVVCEIAVSFIRTPFRMENMSPLYNPKWGEEETMAVSQTAC